MLTYTTRLRRLILPEYGRNIQNMIDYCGTIADRDERNLCAGTIVASMETLLPPSGDAEEYRRKLWDHLAIMSDFSLDVDYPFEPVDSRVFDDGPEHVAIEQTGRLPHRHYGSIIPHMIDVAVAMEPGDRRDALVTLVANQMKKTMLEYTPDNVDDRRILSDLRILSHGQIDTAPERVCLQDFKQAPTPSGKKKKKK